MLGGLFDGLLGVVDRGPAVGEVLLGLLVGLVPGDVSLLCELGQRRGGVAVGDTEFRVLLEGVVQRVRRCWLVAVFVGR
ncbi:hypothetical protein KV205_00195 [Streptomyces sp. SKN60]|uniref:hypothetical protein n=1 Tax=Streptomyces sp. SKN60 TaxID=2855506 RepID=UPI002247EFF6|nr:hypothetical protein [Streptomyces sp. SKN60]MCX2178967.1 hypothetical protein [Streptomyces sp. SKN60]